MTSHKLAVVISHPIQHFAPLFRALAARDEIDLRVFYCCDWGVNDYQDTDFGRTFSWDIPLLEGYPSEFLPISTRPTRLSFRQIDNPRVTEFLEAFGPDAVWVHGYSHRTSWRVLRWAQCRARVLYFGDSELLSPRGVLSKIIKRLVLPAFFRRCDGFLTIGDNNEKYYEHYGVERNRFFRGSFPIDLDRFREATCRLTSDDRHRLRLKFGLDSDSVVVLFVGKFIGIKRPLDLVHAMELLRDQRRSERIQALLVGSGPLEAQIKETVREKQLDSVVRLAGFVNQNEIPQTLWCGDVLAMTSSKDPHPLAVSESMAVGNAIIASDRIGCVGPTDAARVGENCLTYECGSVDALAESIQSIAENSELRNEMQCRSVELAATQSVGQAVDGVTSFLAERCE